MIFHPHHADFKIKPSGLIKREVLLREKVMNCKKMKYLLSDYLDNELNNEEKTLVMEHLNSCKMCAQAFEYQKRIKEILSFNNATENIEPLPFFETRLFNRIKERKSANGFFDDFVIAERKTVFAGVLLLVVFLGAFVFDTYLQNNTNQKVTVDEYLLQNTSNSVEKKIFTEAKISEDDIVNLALAE